MSPILFCSYVIYVLDLLAQRKFKPVPMLEDFFGVIREASVLGVVP